MGDSGTADNGLTARLCGHVQRLAGEIGERNIFRPAALEAAAAYIETVWSGQGYSVSRQTYTARGVASANLEVTRHCGRSAAPVLLLGAHYDSVRGSPGANDNATGVAALLEIGRMLAATEPALDIRCVAFVNEEPPFFLGRHQGSMVYARAARRRGDVIPLMLALEMLGCFDDTPGSQRYPPLLRHFYPATADFIAFVSNLRGRRLLRRMVAAFRAVSDFPAEAAALPALLPGVAWSDHLSFWRHGYRALMVTDTAFYRYPWYHTAGDTPDRIDYPRLAQVTTGLGRAVVHLAGALADRRGAFG